MASMDVENPEQQRAANILKKTKANSTSSVFAQSTLTDPDIDEVIFSVALVLQMQMSEVDPESIDQAALDEFIIFDELYQGDEAEISMTEADKIKRRKQQLKAIASAPSLDYIYKFLKAVYDCAQFSQECIIIAMIFVNRLIATSGMPLHTLNWRPVWLSALLIAQKIWDDRCLVNAHFSMICPMFTTSKFNMYERRFLEYLDYNLSISSRLYAKYYFELRTLMEDQQGAKPFRLQPLNAKAAQSLEARSKKAAADAASSKSESSASSSKASRFASHDSFASKPKNVVLS